MANTAFDHASALTIPGSTTNNGLVRWGDTSGTSFGNITGITSDGSNITLLTRGEIRFSDADSTHFIAFESPATVGTSYTMTLPADLPAADEVLTVTSYSGGAGVLEWASAGGARTVSPTNIDNALITFVDSGDTFTAEANLTFDGTDLTVTSGNVVIATAGKGIDFSAQTATTSGTTTAEVLDHYEEGTWTPTIADSTLNGTSKGQGYDRQTGQYVRIGNRVFFDGSVRITDLGSLTTSQPAHVMGLPFVSANVSFQGPQCPMRGDSLAVTSEASIQGYLESNAAYVAIMEINGTSGNTMLLISELSHNGYVHISGSYSV